MIKLVNSEIDAEVSRHGILLLIGYGTKSANQEEYSR